MMSDTSKHPREGDFRGVDSQEIVIIRKDKEESSKHQIFY